jgi:alginate biosynthesis protein Alg44
MIRAPSIAMPRTAPAHAEPAHQNVVHESETQRQHVRVRLPGFVEFDQGGQRFRAKLFDVSAAGCAFELPRNGLRPGQTLAGTLLVSSEPIGFTLPIKMQVRTSDPNGRVGCRFQDIGPRESGALKQLISSTLAGETVTVGDVMRSGGNGSYTRPRAAKPPAVEAQGFGSRLRALVVSLVALTLGVTAFGYALKQVHQILFVTSASAGKVAGPVYTVSMPREGMFYSLVPEDGIVKKGAAMASFEAPVLDLVRGQSLAANLSSEQLNKMMSQTVKGTITSPCDCRVQAQFVANNQYAGRGEPLFELVPRELKNPYVMARFRFDQMEKVAPGTVVHFRVTGDNQERSGKVAQLRVPNNAENTVGGDVIAMIEPTEPLPADLVNRPARVDVGGIARFNPLAVVSSMADGDSQ